jgi:ABC-type transporter Mla subunit MlaD
MQEGNWGLVLLSAITLVLVIQTAALISLALAGRRLADRARTLEHELRTELGPSLARLRRVAQNAEEVSDRLVAGLPQIEDAVADAADNIQRANRMFERLEDLLSLPLRPIARGLAFLQGFRRPESERPRPVLPAPRP